MAKLFWNGVEVPGWQPSVVAHVLVEELLKYKGGTLSVLDVFEFVYEGRIPGPEDTMTQEEYWKAEWAMEPCGQEWGEYLEDARGSSNMGKSIRQSLLDTMPGRFRL